MTGGATISSDRRDFNRPSLSSGGASLVCRARSLRLSSRLLRVCRGASAIATARLEHARQDPRGPLCSGGARPAPDTHDPRKHDASADRQLSWLLRRRLREPFLRPVHKLADDSGARLRRESRRPQAAPAAVSARLARGSQPVFLAAGEREHVRDRHPFGESIRKGDGDEAAFTPGHDDRPHGSAPRVWGRGRV
jgi:hypothetical protein